MSVSGGKVITNIGYLVMTACVTLVYFSGLRDPYYLYVVSVQVCTNVLFRDVGWDTFQYQSGLHGFW